MSQLPDTKVVGLCTYRCPSLDLAIGDRDERTTGPSHILAELDGITSEEVPVGVILHAREGQISELEVYSIQEFEGAFTLPVIESLKR